MTTLTWVVGEQTCMVTLPTKDAEWLKQELIKKYPNVMIEETKQ